MTKAEQKLVDDELADSRRRLEAWVHRELDQPVPMGAGRNNQMIQLAPRMLELGFDEDAILEKFKAMYELEDSDDKDHEIWKVVRQASRYVQELRIDDPELIKQQKKEAAAKMRAAIRARDLVMTQYAWLEADIRAAGQCDHLKPREQRDLFLWNMFEETEILWCGQIYHSGKDKHRRNFRPQAEWLQGLPAAYMFTSHCTWKSGSISRCNESVDARRYLIVESDTLSRDQVGAVFAWLAAGGLRLRAVVYSGGRSLHGWFSWPEDPSGMAANLVGLQCDPSVMRVSQPVRLPGIIRKDTGNLQELLYLSR